MTVCKFFLKGYCRFGDRCRYEHIETGGGVGGQDFSSNRLKWVNPNLQQISNPASTFSFNQTAQAVSGKLVRFSLKVYF